MQFGQKNWRWKNPFPRGHHARHVSLHLLPHGTESQLAIRSFNEDLGLYHQKMMDLICISSQYSKSSLFNHKNLLHYEFPP